MNIMKFDPKFYTARGRLNRYALACGYVERAQSDYDKPNYRSVELNMSGSVVHVQTYSRETGERKQFGTQRMVLARKVFAAECKRLKVGFRVIV